jgi:hypothetical protein
MPAASRFVVLGASLAMLFSIWPQGVASLPQTSLQAPHGDCKVSISSSWTRMLPGNSQKVIEPEVGVDPNRGEPVAF